MSGNPPGVCPFHREQSADTLPANSPTELVPIFKYPRQVDPTTLCPGLARSDFICPFGRAALKQDKVLAFDLRNLSGADLWKTLLEGIREYVHGSADNFLVTLPESDFLSIRDIQYSAMDMYAVIQMALNQVAVELCVYRDLQLSGHTSEPVSSLLKDSQSIGKLANILAREPFAAALREALTKPDSLFQQEVRVMHGSTQACKLNPNSSLELLKIIQLEGNHLLEGRLHSFYMGPSLENDRLRHNPNHIIVFTRATAFTPQVLGSEVTQKIHALIETEEVRAHLPILAESQNWGQERFLGNKHFAIPCRMLMSEYRDLPVRTSRPADTILPKHSESVVAKKSELKTTLLEGGFQIGNDTFLIDQTEHPKITITYVCKGRAGTLTIQDAPQFYEDMGDLYKRFCGTKAACIYQRIHNTVTGKADECSLVFTVTRDVAQSLK